MQAELLQDLQNSGLLASWQSWGQDVGHLLGTDVCNKDNINMQELPGLVQLEQQERRGSMEASDAPSLDEQPALAMEVDQGTASANQAAEATVAAATDLLQRSRQVLQDVTTANHQIGPVDSGTYQSGTRKSSRGHQEAPMSTGGRGSSGSNTASNKGLRQFALLVCEQVRERGRTTYNEVADLLVQKLGETADGGAPSKDVDKTIRRRVYDAINVLMATDIIQREKKDITWKGLPNSGPGLPQGPGSAAAPCSSGAHENGSRGVHDNSSMGVHENGSRGVHEGNGRVPHERGTSPMGMDMLRQERMRRISDVDRKQTYLQELLDQHASLKHLVKRNATHPERAGTAIHLPFVLIQARPGATVEVDIAEDMQHVQFDFHNSPIQIHDDSGVIKQMTQHRLLQQQHMHAHGANAAKAATPRSAHINHAGLLPPTSMVV